MSLSNRFPKYFVRSMIQIKGIMHASNDDPTRDLVLIYFLPTHPLNAPHFSNDYCIFFYIVVAIICSWNLKVVFVIYVAKDELIAVLRNLVLSKNNWDDCLLHIDS